MKNSVLHLKENALPMRNGKTIYIRHFSFIGSHLYINIISFCIDEDFEEQLEIKSEVIYLKNESDIIEVGADSMSDTSETRDLVPLEPLVEYMNVYEDVREEVELSDVKEEAEGQMMAGENLIIGSSEYVTNNNGTQEISVVGSEENNFGVEPVMPFFLTSSPMFTILNENNEVGVSFEKQFVDLNVYFN